MIKNIRFISRCSPRIYRTAGLSLLLLASGAQALRFEPTDELTIDLDTTLAYGAMWRVESRRELGNIDLITSNPLYMQFANPADPFHEDRVVQWNSDDGTRNFEKGDLVSDRSSIVADFDMKYRDYGVFLRGQMFYDSVYFEETSWDGEGWEDWVSGFTIPQSELIDCDSDGRVDSRLVCGGGQQVYNGVGTYAGPESINNVVASGAISDPAHFSDDVKEKHGYDARFLDAYVYGNFDLGDGRVLDLRLGRQAINWGEALMLQGGIGFAMNRIDATAATSPGVQLKEIFLPSDALYGQLNLTETLTLEAYWQYTYKESELFEAGAYFAQEDFLGSDVFLINTHFNDACMFGFETYGFGADLYGNGGNLECDSDPLVLGPNPGRQHWIVSNPNAMYRSEDKYPDKPQDQFGVALRMLFEGGSEAGVYFVQYHDKYPSVWAANNGGVADFQYAQDAAYDPTWVGAPSDSTDAIGGNISRYTIEYKERIKLYGLTYNTVFGDIQMGFEFTYRENQPVVPACTTESLNDLSFDESLPDANDNYAAYQKAMSVKTPCKDESLKMWLAMPGVYNFFADDYASPSKANEVATRLFAWPTEAEVFTYNVGMTAVVPPTPLWDTGIFVAEFGGVYVGSGFEDEDLKVTEAGAFTQQAYGFSFIFLPQYKNIVEGVDLTLPFFVAYTIDGSFAYFNYQEDSLWWSLGAEAVYLSNLTTGITYSQFNSNNRWSDRDNIAFNIKYSF